jgi:hypothetical protein
MFQKKPRRFGRNSNGRSHRPHGGTGMQTRPRTNSFSNAQPRNSFRPSMSAEKLFEKYTNLAKEAMSSGDKTSSENFLQHADHFMRIIEDKNKNRLQSKVNVIDKPIEDKNKIPDSVAIKENNKVDS